jgi:hypothetical protein
MNEGEGKNIILAVKKRPLRRLKSREGKKEGDLINV